MISIQSAAANAQKYLIEVIGAVQGPRVEEIEKHENEWLVTLSYLVERDPREPREFGERTGVMARHYKVFEVRADSGEVISMKMRRFQDA